MIIASLWHRRLCAAALLGAMALLLVDIGKLIAVAIPALTFPYDLDYGEGIVWQQMDNIVAGQGYAPLGTFPAIVYHYPPVYHLTVAGAVTMTGLDPLFAGRLVSLLATICACAMIGWLAAATRPEGTDGRATIVGAAIGSLMFAVSPTVQLWALLMRVDMLATALTLAGFCLVVREIARPRAFPWSAIPFALAVYTKQTAVIGPAAAFLALCVVQPRAGWRFLIVCAGLGLAALVPLMIASDGNFLRHVVEYNVNRFDPTRWRLLVYTLGENAVLIGIAVLVAARMVREYKDGPAPAWRSWAGASARNGALFVLLIYFALRLLTLPLVLKSGANDNYMIDLFSVAAILVGTAAISLGRAAFEGLAWPRAVVALPLLAIIPIQVIQAGPAMQAAQDPGMRAANAMVAARIRQSARPVISDYMVTLKRAGQPVLYEPAIAAELAHSGLYHEAGFVRLIRARAFGFFVTQGGDGDYPYRERYNPGVARAIAQAYPRIERYGEMVIHLPAAPPVR